KRRKQEAGNFFEKYFPGYAGCEICDLVMCHTFELSSRRETTRGYDLQLQRRDLIVEIIMKRREETH
ncbi:MAG: hypothetical protein ACJ749_07370, partial [Flavisolibacter sp.]